MVYQRGINLFDVQIRPAAEAAVIPALSIVAPLLLA